MSFFVIFFFKMALYFPLPDFPPSKASDILAPKTIFSRNKLLFCRARTEKHSSRLHTLLAIGNDPKCLLIYHTNSGTAIPNQKPELAGWSRCVGFMPQRMKHSVVARRSYRKGIDQAAPTSQGMPKRRYYNSTNRSESGLVGQLNCV